MQLDCPTAYHPASSDMFICPDERRFFFFIDALHFPPTLLPLLASKRIVLSLYGTALSYCIRCATVVTAAAQSQQNSMTPGDRQSRPLICRSLARSLCPVALCSTLQRDWSLSSHHRRRDKIWRPLCRIQSSARGCRRRCVTNAALHDPHRLQATRRCQQKLSLSKLYTNVFTTLISIWYFR